ncbi:MAG: ATP-dependent sacrificial sulfur transferase LarE [Candidatus Bathyarchaeota archaeon]|nr:MAG: ATP-dependent sacrificial sulfur transferase LarE [Candidatus Bathyarchaeota archaeon]
MTKKVDEIKHFIANKGKNGVVIAFSGGVDSTTLAALCYEVLGPKAVAVTAISPTYTTKELEDSENAAKQIGIKQHIVKTYELSNENFRKNPENRCYFCKKELLKQMQEIAKKLGFKAIFEGTNFSELTGHRPGFVAVQESKNVYSPWAANKFTRQEIRLVAKGLGLSVFNKPSNACLASRIPFNEQITAEKLDRIAQAEQIIRNLTGVTQLRVRDHNSFARIEVPKNEINLFSKNEVLDKIVKELKAIGFKFVTVDLEGYRTGSMLGTLDN